MTYQCRLRGLVTGNTPLTIWLTPLPALHSRRRAVHQRPMLRLSTTTTTTKKTPTGVVEPRAR
jgi:hypothetical protein